MSLVRRGAIWHYDFQVGGVRYRGSTGQRARGPARRVEQEIRRAAELEVARTRLIADGWAHESRNSADLPGKIDAARPDTSPNLRR